MKISDLSEGVRVPEIDVEIVDKSETREFVGRYGGGGKVCDATVKDDTGEIKLTLWNKEIDQVQVGDKVRITNGYVKEWHDRLQLSAGRYGKLEVIE